MNDQHHTDDQHAPPIHKPPSVPLQPVVQLLLRWYYGYHNAVVAHKADNGDSAIKPHFLSVYRETDELLGAMRDKGEITDQMCDEAINELNPGLQGTGHLVDRTLQGVVGTPNQKGEA